MTDSDFNYITPVENLHSVHSLSPAQGREEQKRKQKQPRQQPEQKQAPEARPAGATSAEPASEQNEVPHRIDYCA